MGRTQLELLERDGRYISAPKGISMRPMIKAGRDAVVIEKLKKPPRRYDLVLYTRPGDLGVLHRVIRFKDGVYIICGDNCSYLEYVKPARIKGIVTEFYHKNRWIKVDNRLYQLYVHFWVNTLPVRLPVFRVRDKMKAVYRRIRRLWLGK